MAGSELAKKELAKKEWAKKTQRSGLAGEFHQELIAIADWWVAHSQDSVNGGFYGEVGLDNQPRPNADKSVVLNTRILWFFSALAERVDDPRYRAAADRAYLYLMDHFLDRELGGVYWMLNAEGRPKDTKKQVYAQAFAIYALGAYYQLTGECVALQEAQKLFVLLEQHTVDRNKGGYLEAFTRSWEAMDDVRLSDKDLNFPKTMNTHLHVLEAYSILYQLDKSESVATALRYTIECFDQHIIDKTHFHLRMFMDHDWRDHSPGFTYGHDIETSWLLAKAVESLNDENVTARMQPVILNIVEVCLQEAMGDYGEMYDGYEFASATVNRERVWWVQAEAMVGYVKAYTLCGDARYMDAAELLWDFIKKYQYAEGGEWLWLSRLDEQVEAPAYKLGAWKGPYHNGRAMLELERLMNY